MGIIVGSGGEFQIPQRHQPPPRFNPFDEASGHHVPFFEDMPEETDSPSILESFIIVEERADYLICRRGPQGGRVNVAKPKLLQWTPWDGQTVGFSGKSVSFEYGWDSSGGGVLKRIARATVGVGEDAEEIEEVQRITMDYIPGDTIVAAPNGTKDGKNRLDNLVRTEDGRRLGWVDLNIGGRCWAVALDEEPE